VIIAAPTSVRHGCIMADWSQPRKGKKLVTLKGAAAYIMAVPESKTAGPPERQAAAAAPPKARKLMAKPVPPQATRKLTPRE
jgi:hypothetical protein